MQYGQPPKKKHRTRNILLSVLAVFVVLSVIGAIEGNGNKDKTGSAASPTTPAAATSAAATTTKAHATTVTPATSSLPATSSPPATTDAPATTAEPTSAAPKSAAPTTTAKPAPTTTKAKPAPAGPSFGDGTYLIGKDIPAGIYRTKGDDGCYWEREHDLKGSLDSIAVNDNSEGQVVVQILATDAAFKSDGCGTWHLLPKTGPQVTSFGNGRYAVGIDIAPGTYKTAGGDGCYWERDSNLSYGGLTSIIANDNADGPAVVRIAASDKGFKTQDCGTWTRDSG
jgi:hypothetical protein